MQAGCFGPWSQLNHGLCWILIDPLSNCNLVGGLVYNPWNSNCNYLTDLWLIGDGMIGDESTIEICKRIWVFPANVAPHENTDITMEQPHATDKH